MKTVWFIEDEPDLLEILEFMIESISEEKDLKLNFKYISNWSMATPAKGDLVIHDLVGVGKKVVSEGVDYLVCSGSVEEDYDLHKPYDFKKIEDILVSI